jgi:hypothetical protein
MNYGIIKTDGTIEAPVTMKKTYNGVRGFHLLTPAELATHGWFECNINNASVDEDRYIRSTYPICSFDGTTITATYIVVEKSIELVKTTKKADLSKLFKEISARPVVPTSLGFSVDGNLLVLRYFEIAEEHAIDNGFLTVEVKASDNVKYTINTTDFAEIITNIKLNGLELYKIKWAKETEIESSLTPWDVNIEDTF